jgi:hypothetical protein
LGLATECPEDRPGSVDETSAVRFGVWRFSLKSLELQDDRLQGVFRIACQDRQRIRPYPALHPWESLLVVYCDAAGVLIARDDPDFLHDPGFLSGKVKTTRIPFASQVGNLIKQRGPVSRQR